MNKARHPTTDRNGLCNVVAPVFAGKVAATSVELIISTPVNMPDKRHLETEPYES